MEIKDLLSQFDITLDDGKELNAENIKTAFNEKFISKALIDSDEEIQKRITGKVTGTTLTALQRELKSMDIELTSEEKAMPLPEIQKIAMAKVNQKIAKIQADSSLTADEKAKALLENIEKLKGENETFKSMAETNKAELENAKTSYQRELEAFKINSELNEIRAKIPFSKEVSEVTKVGFDAILKSKYNFTLKEGGGVTVTDKEGKPIKNEKNTDLATALEVIMKEAKDNNLIQNSNPPGTGAGVPKMMGRKDGDTPQFHSNYEAMKAKIYGKN